MAGHETSVDVRAGRAVVVWGVVAVAVILASTLEVEPLRESLALRLAVLGVGLVPAALVLRRLAPGGVVDHRNARRLFIAVLAVHALATLYFFPPADILNDRPVVTLDHAFHYYQAERAREVFWDTLRIDRYDPYFMAGYPGGTIFDLDMKGAETFCALLPLVGVARSLKWFILCAYLLIVPSLYRGSRLQGFRIGESAAGLLVFLAFWHWGRPYAGDFRYAGMFAFVFATHLCFLLVGLLRRAASRRGAWAFLLLGPAAFLVHPTAVVMLPVPFAVALGIDRRAWRARRWWLLVAWCAAVVALNVLWLRPFFEYLWMKTTTEVYYQIEGWRGLAHVLLRPTCGVALAMVALAALGIVRLARERRLGVGLPAAAGSVFLLGVAGWGVYVPGVDQMEPGRFLFAAFVFLSPLAGVGLDGIVGLIAARAGRPGRAVRTVALVSLALVSLPLSLVESKSFYRHTITTSLRPRVAALAAQVRSRVHRPGRLMIEDCAAIHYGDVHLPALLPLTTGVEQIGGPYPQTFLLYYFTSFRWEQTFGRPIESWDRESFALYASLYDVRWIVTATDRVGRTVSRLVGRPPDWFEPPYAMWRLDRPRAAGAPVVDARVNRLEVTGDPDESGYFIDYHWVPGLTASGAARIRPRHRLDDPVPFIYVEPNGERSLTISY